MSGGGTGADASGNVDSIILEEEIDPSYVPSDAEVVEYAKWLGMDLNIDQDLFWVAREGLMAPLPKNWKPCKTKDTEDIYYFNFATGESTWDHPCDGYYKRLYEEEKKKKEMCMKESNDQVRNKAKQDVEVLLGKNEKKKKKKTTTTQSLEAPGLKTVSSLAPKLITPLERKPLPDILSKPSPSSEPSIQPIIKSQPRESERVSSSMESASSSISRASHTHSIEDSVDSDSGQKHPQLSTKSNSFTSTSSSSSSQGNSGIPSSKSKVTRMKMLHSSNEEDEDFKSGDNDDSLVRNSTSSIKSTSSLNKERESIELERATRYESGSSASQRRRENNDTESRDDSEANHSRMATGVAPQKDTDYDRRYVDESKRSTSSRNGGDSKSTSAENDRNHHVQPFDSTDTYVEDLRFKLRQVEDEKTVITRRYERLCEQNEDTEKRLARVREDNMTLRDALNRAEGFRDEANDARTKLKSLENANSRLERENSRLNERVKDLEDRINDNLSVKTIEGAQNEIGDAILIQQLKASEMKLRSQVAELEAKVQELELHRDSGLADQGSLIEISSLRQERDRLKADMLIEVQLKDRVKKRNDELQADVDDCYKKIENLRFDLDDKESKLQSANRELRLLQQQQQNVISSSLSSPSSSSLSDLQTALATLEAAKSSLESKLELQEKSRIVEISALEEKLNESMKQLVEAKRKEEDANSNVKRLEQKVALWERDCEDIEKKLKQEREQSSAWQERFYKTEADLVDMITKQSKLAVLNNENKIPVEMIREKEMLEVKLAEATSEIAALKNQIAKQLIANDAALQVDKGTADIEAALVTERALNLQKEKKIRDFQEEIIVLQRRLSDLESERQTPSIKSTSPDPDKQRDETEIARLNNHIKIITDQLAAHSKDSKDFSTRLQMSEELAQSRLEKIKELEKEIDFIRNSASETERLKSDQLLESNRITSSKLEISQRECETLLNKCAYLGAEVTRYQNECLHHESQIRDLEVQARKYQGEAQIARVSVDMHVAEIAQLRTVIESERNERVRLSSELDANRKVVSQLRSELASMKSEALSSSLPPSEPTSASLPISGQKLTHANGEAAQTPVISSYNVNAKGSYASTERGESVTAFGGPDIVASGGFASQVPVSSLVELSIIVGQQQSNVRRLEEKLRDAEAIISNFNSASQENLPPNVDRNAGLGAVGGATVSKGVTSLNATEAAAEAEESCDGEGEYSVLMKEILLEFSRRRKSLGSENVRGKKSKRRSESASSIPSTLGNQLAAPLSRNSFMSKLATERKFIEDARALLREEKSFIRSEQERLNKRRETWRQQKQNVDPHDEAGRLSLKGTSKLLNEQAARLNASIEQTRKSQEWLSERTRKLDKMEKLLLSLEDKKDGIASVGHNFYQNDVISALDKLGKDLDVELSMFGTETQHVALELSSSSDDGGASAQPSRFSSHYNQKQQTQPPVTMVYQYPGPYPMPPGHVFYGSQPKPPPPQPQSWEGYQYAHPYHQNITSSSQMQPSAPQSSSINTIPLQSQVRQEMKSIIEQRQQTNEAYDTHATWLEGLRQEIGRFSHSTVPPPLPLSTLSTTKKEVQNILDMQMKSAL